MDIFDLKIIKIYNYFMKKIIIFNLSFIIISYSSLFAQSNGINISHGGGLDSEGCHNDKKNNSYHCHTKNSQKDKLESNNKYVIIESCYDGDTCTTLEGEKIRLACIDTPELRGPKAQPNQAKAARDYLNNLIAGKEVFIKRINRDRYGRTVAEISINGKNIQQTMFKSGYAEIYSKYAYQCPWAR